MKECREERREREKIQRETEKRTKTEAARRERKIVKE